MLFITAMLKDGGYRQLQITPEYLGQLAESIQKQGYEWVTLVKGPIAIVGFMVVGNQVGDRVIVLGGAETKSS